MEVVDQSVQSLTDVSDDFNLDHDAHNGIKMTELGFPIAGHIRDLYLDAVICIPPMFKWQYAERELVMGRVLHINDPGLGVPVEFVLIDADGIQSSRIFGHSYHCFFALPENTEDKFRS